MKIRLPDGREAVTTTTHRHVKNSLKFWQVGAPVKRVLAKLEDASRSLINRLGCAEPEKSESQKVAALEKLAYIEGEPDQIATIMRTYDEPSSILS